MVSRPRCHAPPTWVSAYCVRVPLPCRMIKVSDAFAWDEMCDMSEEDMDNLLSFYAKDDVPSLDILKSMRGDPQLTKVDVFDGSYGFSVGA